MHSTTPITLITGGSRGLGRNAAHALAAAGHDIVLTYHRQADDAAAVVAHIQQLGRRAHALQLDTADVSTFADFAAQLKDVLAGWSAPSSMRWSTTPAPACMRLSPTPPRISSMRW